MLQRMYDHHNISNHSGDYLLLNVSTDNIEKYTMKFEPEIQTYLPMPRPITVDEQEQFENISDWTSEIKRLTAHYLDLPFYSTLGYGTYDLAYNDPRIRDVIQDYKDNANIIRQIQEIGRSILSISTGGVSIGYEYKFEVILADGGTAELVFDGFKSGFGNYDLKLRKIIDPDGNTVPEQDIKKSKIVFRFTDVENFQAWYAYMKENYNLNDDEIAVTFVERLPLARRGDITVTDLDSGNPKISAPKTNEPVEEEP